MGEKEKGMRDEDSEASTKPGDTFIL